VDAEQGDGGCVLDHGAPGAFHSRIAFCLNTHNEAVRVRVQHQLVKQALKREEGVQMQQSRSGCSGWKSFLFSLSLRLMQALRFPPNAHKQELEDGDKRRERQQQEQELAKHIAEEADGDF